MIGYREGGFYVEPKLAPGSEDTNPLIGYQVITGRVPGLMLRGDSLTALVAEQAPLPSMVVENGALFGQPVPGAGAQGEPNDTPLVVELFQFAEVVGRRVKFADNAIGDEDASRSWSVDVLFRTTSDAAPSNASGVIGKRESGGNLRGWEMTLNTAGDIVWALKDATDTQVTQSYSTYNNALGQNRYADGLWHWSTLQVDVAAGEIRTATEHGLTMTSAWAPASLAAVAPLSIGAVRAFAAPVQVAIAVWSYGAQAVADDPFERCDLLSENTHLVVVEKHRNEASP